MFGCDALISERVLVGCCCGVELLELSHGEFVWLLDDVRLGYLQLLHLYTAARL